MVIDRCNGNLMYAQIGGIRLFRKEGRSKFFTYRCEKCGFEGENSGRPVTCDRSIRGLDYFEQEDGTTTVYRNSVRIGDVRKFPGDRYCWQWRPLDTLPWIGKFRSRREAGVALDENTPQ